MLNFLSAQFPFSNQSDFCSLLPQLPPCLAAGVRLFDLEVAKGVACTYRATYDGLPYLLPYMSKQRSPCSLPSVISLLQAGALHVEGVLLNRTTKVTEKQASQR